MLSLIHILAGEGMFSADVVPFAMDVAGYYSAYNITVLSAAKATFQDWEATLGKVDVYKRQAVEKGKATRPNIKLGICGEHGGDPSSVEFCHRVGLNYVSCSPFRVPIARLAAAQAALKDKQ